MVLVTHVSGGRTAHLHVRPRNTAAIRAYGRAVGDEDGLGFEVIADALSPYLPHEGQQRPRSDRAWAASAAVKRLPVVGDGRTWVAMAAPMVPAGRHRDDVRLVTGAHGDMPAALWQALVQRVVHAEQEALAGMAAGDAARGDMLVDAASVSKVLRGDDGDGRHDEDMRYTLAVAITRTATVPRVVRAERAALAGMAADDAARGDMLVDVESASAALRGDDERSRHDAGTRHTLAAGAGVARGGAAAAAAGADAAETGGDVEMTDATPHGPPAAGADAGASRAVAAAGHGAVPGAADASRLAQLVAARLRGDRERRSRAVAADRRGRAAPYPARTAATAD